MSDSLSEEQTRLCKENTTDFSDLKATFINCTLKKSPTQSHTEGLLAVSRAIMRANGVSVTDFRAVDLDIASGVWPDMTEHGWDRDDWPKVYKTIMDSDILVLGTPIWLGEKSSVCQRVIERLYAQSGKLNEHGQYAYYGRVGGCIVTGNEDGIKHVGMGVL